MANNILVTHERIKNTLMALGLEVVYHQKDNDHAFYIRKRTFLFFSELTRVCLLGMYAEDIITCGVSYNLDEEIELAVDNVLKTQGMRCTVKDGRYSRIYHLQ